MASKGPLHAPGPLHHQGDQYDPSWLPQFSDYDHWKNHRSHVLDSLLGQGRNARAQLFPAALRVEVNAWFAQGLRDLLSSGHHAAPEPHAHDQCQSLQSMYALVVLEDALTEVDYRRSYGHAHDCHDCGHLYLHLSQHQIRMDSNLLDSEAVAHVLDDVRQQKPGVADRLYGLKSRPQMRPIY